MKEKGQKSIMNFLENFKCSKKKNEDNKIKMQDKDNDDVVEEKRDIESDNDE